MPFGKPLVDPLEQLHSTMDEAVQGELKIGATNAQQKYTTQQKKTIGDIMAGYNSGVADPDSTPVSERVLATDTFTKLQSMGTPEGRQAATDFMNFRKTVEPPKVTNEFEGLVNEYGGDFEAAETEYNKRLNQRIAGRKNTRARTAYEDFSGGYPDTPEGRHQSALDFIQAQTAQKIQEKAAGGGGRKTQATTKPAKDKNGNLVWMGVDNQGQPFMVYPKEKITWDQWNALHETAKEKTIKAVGDMLTKSIGENSNTASDTTGQAKVNAGTGGAAPDTTSTGKQKVDY